MEETASTPKKSTISIDVAQQEVDTWLDAKHVKPKKRLEYRDTIEDIVSAVQEGILVLNEDKTFTHQLLFPLTSESGDSVASSLTYKMRITQADKRPHLKLVRPGDLDGKITATIAALTGQSFGIIEKLDIEDRDIAQSIALFFY